MKIGILTLPLHTNYGGILQAYALQTVLEQLGHEVVIYQKAGPSHKLAIWRYPFVYSKRIARKLLRDKHTVIFLEKKLEKDTKIIRQNTDSFINKYINAVYIDNLSDIDLNEVDVIVVGSDQIWRPKYVKVTWGAIIQDTFLNFAKKWQGKRIAYAASFGTDEWEFTKTETSDCRDLMKLFNAVSVREAQGQKFCKKYFGVCSTQVLDPTLLLNAEDYCKLVKIDTFKGKRKILFNYILDESEEKSELLTQISNAKNLELYSSRIKNNNKYAPIGERIVPPVEFWLEGLFNADFVVTDSFHGCVFSIIFGKPFVAITNNRRGSSRFHSLFKLLGLEDHLISDIHDYLPHCSYSIPLTVYDKLQNLKNISRNFLIKNI
jgi:hypothetical protein